MVFFGSGQNPKIFIYGQILIKNGLNVLIFFCTCHVYWSLYEYKRNFVPQPRGVGGGGKIFKSSFNGPILTKFRTDVMLSGPSKNVKKFLSTTPRGGGMVKFSIYAACVLWHVRPSSYILE